MNLINIQLDKQKKILIVIFFILIIYVDINFILKAQVSGLNSLNLKVSRLEKDLANLKQNLERMRVSKNAGMDLQKTAAKSSKILPEGQISGLLQDIAKEANKFEVKISQIRSGRDPKTTKSAGEPDKFTPYLINLDLVCDYHNLGKFINALENFPVFIEVQELKIATQLPDYMKQKVSLILRTYVTK